MRCGKQRSRWFTRSRGRCGYVFVTDRRECITCREQEA